MKVYGYWHNRAVDGKAHCNHYAHDVGGDCGKPDLGVWTPLVKMTPEMAEDIAWLAKLAQGSSWPGEMADRVQQAVNRVIREYGSDAERAAVEAVAAILRNGGGLATGEEAMEAPTDLIEAVAEVLWNGDSEPFIRWANLAEPAKEMQRDSARRVLAVPGIADALRAAERDAKVAGWVADAIEGDLDLTAPALGRAVAVVHVAEIPPPVPRIAYTFRTRVGGAVCPGCERVVGVGDDAIQWTDDAITHKFCPRPPIVEIEEQR